MPTPTQIERQLRRLGHSPLVWWESDYTRYRFNACGQCGQPVNLSPQGQVTGTAYEEPCPMQLVTVTNPADLGQLGAGLQTLHENLEELEAFRKSPSLTPAERQNFVIWLNASLKGIEAARSWLYKHHPELG